LLVFCHRPESWNGKDDLTAAISAGGADRYKPVLMLNEKFVAGKPFRARESPNSSPHRSGVGDLLRGEGTRHLSAIAIAESIEFEFVDPEGGTETVSRDIFDTIGKAERATGKLPTAEEIATHSAKEQIENDAFALFFATGPINAGLFPRRAAIGEGKILAATDV